MVPGLLGLLVVAWNLKVPIRVYKNPLSPIQVQSDSYIHTLCTIHFNIFISSHKWTISLMFFSQSYVYIIYLGL
jgi:hypothetical protein